MRRSLIAGNSCLRLARRLRASSARRHLRRPPIRKAPPGAIHFGVPDDPTKEQGRAVAADGGYGSRSQFETELRGAYPTPNENTSWSLTPLDKMLGNLTASGLHFERHHGGIPTIDPAKHNLCRSRHGGHAEEIFDDRHQAVSFRHPQAFHRMLRAMD